jgi:hypothetical protein
MIESIMTPEAEVVIDIFKRISNTRARVLFYQCVFHIELFRKASDLLKEAKETLDYHNFARSQSCHMTEGIFGTDRHAARMETAKILTLGYLGVTVSSGHKFLRSLRAARNKDSDRSAQWMTDRVDVSELESCFRHARNAYQHLDQAIDRGQVVSDEDFSFSVHDVLHFKDKDGQKRTLDFSPDALARLTAQWDKTVSTIRSN